MARAVADQVVVVTGASSGVGRAIARAFGDQGAKVALIARNDEALRNAAGEIEKKGGEALVLPLDVADAAAVDRAADQVMERWGRIDTWVNCAMLTVVAPAWDTTPEEFRRVTEATYLGYVHGTLAALRHMRARDEGTIIQIGSALAYRSIPLQSAYCAAKAAIRGFTDALRSELIHEGINVKLSQVHLPVVNTPQSVRQRNKMPKQQQPVPPLFTPESIAERVVWAAQHQPREMLLGWPTTTAVWGQKLIRACSTATSPRLAGSRSSSTSRTSRTARTSCSTHSRVTPARTAPIPAASAARIGRCASAHDPAPRPPAQGCWWVWVPSRWCGGGSGGPTRPCRSSLPPSGWLRKTARRVLAHWVPPLPGRGFTRGGWATPRSTPQDGEVVKRT